jgi:hypothetical protein
MSQQQPKIKVTKAEKLKKQPKAGNNNPAFITYQNKIREYLKKEGYYYNKKAVQHEISILGSALYPGINKALIFEYWKKNPNTIFETTPKQWKGRKGYKTRLKNEKAKKKAQKEKEKEEKEKEKKKPGKYPKDIRTFYGALIVNRIDELYKKRITIEVQYSGQSWVIDTLDKKLAFDMQVYNLLRYVTERAIELDVDSPFTLFPLQEVEEDIFILWWENIEIKPNMDIEVDSYFYEMTETE